MEKLYLIYSEKLNDFPNSDGEYEYDLYFSEKPELAWGTDWNQNCPSACGRDNMRPDEGCYQMIKRLKTDIFFIGIRDNSCFSAQDMTDGIIACMWEDLSGYEEYPEPIRLVFKFGEDIESIKNKLNQRELSLEE